MALTITLDTPSHHVIGHQYKVTGRLAFDATYPGGGEALAASSLGLRTIDSIVFESSGRHGYIYYTDTVLPATSINVEILCPTGGTAPTSVAAPVPTIGTLDATIDAGAVAMTSSAANGAVATVTGAPALTGGRGVEMGAADASTLTALRFTALGV